MAKWNDMQERAKKLIDEGMAMLKIGMHEAGFLAGSTASAARLHVEASRKRFDLYRVLHDLGDEIYASLKADPALQHVELSSSMRSLVEAADDLTSSLEHDERELEGFSVVKRKRGGPPKPAASRPRGSQKAGGGSSSAGGKKATKRSKRGAGN
ncbi:MAG TPA: hypothetical protein PLZ86_06380 [bacterium]|nr:hypothetical protein [bacterium]